MKPEDADAIIIGCVSSTVCAVGLYAFTPAPPSVYVTIGVLGVAGSFAFVWLVDKLKRR